MLDTALLTTTLAAWNIAHTPEQIGRWQSYLALLEAWNTRFNLVAASTLADATRRHLLDALVLATAWHAPTAPARIADVGSGAGLPGVPLAILWPASEVLLIESTGKKASFLRTVVSELGLGGVTVLAERAEVVGHGPWRETCDLVCARAVAPLATLAEYCLPLCRVGGWWFAPKGAAIDAELHAAQAALAELGGTLDSVYDVAVPGEPVRALVTVRKTAAAPGAMPRAVGLPAHRPL